MHITGPLFKWFGSKWLSSKTLPAPRFDTIIEPFAGGAGYSLRHSYKQVIICETDLNCHKLWHWLINEATCEAIREIPIKNLEGADIREMGLSEGQALLLKSWQRTNSIGNCWTISKWGNGSGQWSANTRARLSNEVQFIKHWRLGRNATEPMAVIGLEPATWFIDPPYQYNFQYGANPLDYNALGQSVRKLRGQVIVCEAIDPKEGRLPDWLPFKYFDSRPTSRRKATNNNQSHELIYEATQ